ncbi:UPF0481 protein At3g47200-like [Apium graveolens]|uniref:UPF0481 protein At3g47200-like n=1 Tax=Apium graveolens TaxID=4045 RepID=UPI003D7B58D5
MDSGKKGKNLKLTQTPTFKWRISKNYSSGGEEKFQKWFESVDKTLNLLRSRPRESSAYRVPGKLRATKHEAYTPQMVSIGPFHKRKAKFHAMEELKWLYMLAFVDRAKMQTKEFSALYVYGKNILDLEEKARAWYAEDIDLDKHQFVEMLLVDGCFILELFYRCKMINTQKFEDEFLQGNFTMVQTLKHDLMLLENQIPYFVLQKLFDLVSNPNTASDGTHPHMSLEDYVLWFFDSVPMLRLNYLKAPKNKKDGTYNHLLELLHHVCNVTFVPKLPSTRVPKSCGFTRSATQLFKSGFQIARGYRSIVDIRFIYGIIFIPQVVIDKSSDTIFRNLIALEQISVGTHTITSYVKLMSTLIRSPEDANLLERLNVIMKSEDVEDITNFFKSLCSQVAFVDFCYADLCNEVENYQIPVWRWRRVKGYLSISIKYVEWKVSYKDLKRDYFKNRWSFIAFLAAFFVIVLGILQTFYTVRAYYPPYH